MHNFADHVIGGINRLLFHNDLKMQMGTRTAARISNGGNQVTALHFLAPLNKNFLEMAVSGCGVVEMTDDNQVPITHVFPGHRNNAIAGAKTGVPLLAAMSIPL